MEPTIVLQRGLRNEYGTFGEMLDKASILCKTLERIWLKNANNISCIPTGAYKCVPDYTAKFPYKHYLLLNVRDRVAVKIHRGNWITDTHGCILVGLKATTKGIEQSKAALDMLIEKYPKGFTLVVKD